MLRNEIQKIRIVHRESIRAHLVMVAIGAILGVLLVAVALLAQWVGDKVAQAGREAVVEQDLIHCLNHGVFAVSDGSIVNCEGVVTSSYKLVGDTHGR